MTQQVMKIKQFINMLENSAKNENTEYCCISSSFAGNQNAPTQKKKYYQLSYSIAENLFSENQLKRLITDKQEESILSLCLVLPKTEYINKEILEDDNRGSGE